MNQLESPCPKFNERSDIMNMKKNMLRILSFILLFNFIFVDNIIVNATPIKLNRTSLTMEYKEGYYLKLNTIYKPTWHSKNTKIATISRDGFVRAKNIGSTVVVAKLKGKEYVCKITVKKEKFKTYKLSNKQSFCGKFYNRFCNAYGG